MAVNPSARRTTTFANGVAGTSGTVVARIDLSGLSANIPATRFYIVPTGGGGMYRVTGYSVVMQTATTSSTLAYPSVAYTDSDAGVSVGVNLGSTTNSANTLGTSNVVGGTSNSQAVYVRGGSQINYATGGYVSAGATPMLFALHIQLEYMG
jgi:hypothetical protein